ncbi:MAG: sensor histidine kinase [Anaerolineae bacterium]
MLERLFFHDIGNTAGAIQGLAELVEMTGSMEELDQFDFKNLLSHASHQLVDEIAAQRQLLAAEKGELTTQWGPLAAMDILEEVMQLYKNHLVAEDRLIRLDPKSKTVSLISDRALLGRVIGNMVKNALEAAHPGETVTIGCDRFTDKVRFWVHNPTFMPRHVQLQIFQRSFSTKGKDRGLGTYSIKLLTEQYLQGVVSFRSDQEKGTIFVTIFPRQPESPVG